MVNILLPVRGQSQFSISDHTSALTQRCNEVIVLSPEIIRCYECGFYKLFPFGTKPKVGWSQLVVVNSALQYIGNTVYHDKLS